MDNDRSYLLVILSAGALVVNLAAACVLHSRLSRLQRAVVDRDRQGHPASSRRRDNSLDCQYSSDDPDCYCHHCSEWNGQGEEGSPSPEVEDYSSPVEEESEVEWCECCASGSPEVAVCECGSCGLEFTEVSRGGAGGIPLLRIGGHIHFSRIPPRDDVTCAHHDIENYECYDVTNSAENDVRRSAEPTAMIYPSRSKPSSVDKEKSRDKLTATGSEALSTSQLQNLFHDSEMNNLNDPGRNRLDKDSRRHPGHRGVTNYDSATRSSDSGNENVINQWTPEPEATPSDDGRDTVRKGRSASDRRKTSGAEIPPKAERNLNTSSSASIVTGRRPPLPTTIPHHAARPVTDEGQDQAPDTTRRLSRVSSRTSTGEATDAETPELSPTAQRRRSVSRRGSDMREIYREVDRLYELDGEEDKIKGQRILINKQKDMPWLNNDVEFAWRMVRSTFHHSELEGERGRAARQKELIRECRELAQRALRMGNSNAQVHKWWAIATMKAAESEDLIKKIRAASEFKKHADISLRLDNKDATVYHMVGRWYYVLYKLSWIEKTAASAVIAGVKSFTVDDALKYLLKSEELEPGYKDNLLLLAKCYIDKKDQPSAVKYLKLAKSVQVKNKKNEETHREVLELLRKYK